MPTEWVCQWQSICLSGLQWVCLLGLHRVQFSLFGPTEGVCVNYCKKPIQKTWRPDGTLYKKLLKKHQSICLYFTCLHLFPSPFCLTIFSCLKRIVMQMFLKSWHFVVLFAEEKEEKLKITKMSEFRKQGVTILSGKIVIVSVMYMYFHPVLSFSIVHSSVQFVSNSVGFDCCSSLFRSFHCFSFAHRLCTLFSPFCWFKTMKAWSLEGSLVLECFQLYSVLQSQETHLPFRDGHNEDSQACLLTLVQNQQNDHQLSNLEWWCCASLRTCTGSLRN